MATFEAQVEGLTSLAIDGSSAPTQDELTQFLTDGAKEIINNLPGHLLPLCASSNTFTSGSADTLVTGKILNVFRNDGDINQPCRKIPAKQKGRVSDPDDMAYATITDPVFFIDNNTLDVLPAGGSCSYSAVAYPSVAYTASSITAFPNEAEHLVVLYGAVKSLQNILGSRTTNSDITTAIGAIKTAVDQAATAAGKFTNADSDSVFGDESTFLTNESQLTRVKAALDNAEDVINSNQPSSTTDAYGALANEDTEIVQSALSVAGTEIQRAQAHLSEWTSIGDMRVKEVNAALSEARGYADEVQSRLQVDSAQYGWYEKQQAKLQSDYEKGLQALG